MDPLSIAGASISIAGAIGKASLAIYHFSREARDATDDLSGIEAELNALRPIVDALAHSLLGPSDVPEKLVQKLQGSLEGCLLVVKQITELVGRYSREGVWTRTKWVLVGQGDMEKLRESLSSYKMALGLGLHFVSQVVQDRIKRDVGALRDDNRVLLEYAAVSRDNTNEIPAMKNNINEILARVNSIRQGRGSGSTARVEQWMEDIEVLTSYAETTYQGTIVDPDEKGPTGLHQHQEVGMPTINDEQEEGSGSTEDVVTLAPEVSNFGRLSVQEDNEYVPSGRRVTSPSQGSEDNDGNEDEFPRKPAGNGYLDVVVGIDIGESSTAVSISGRGTSLYHLVSEWPGGNAERVPTVVSHSKAEGPPAWGFQCVGRKNVQTLSLMELLQLSGDTISSDNAHRDIHDAWVLFLSLLYRHIREGILNAWSVKPQNWMAMAIEFHFTLPDLIHKAPPSSMERALTRLKETVRDAGFGTEARHCAVFSLTETEAVATTLFGLRGSQDINTLLVKVGEGNVAVVEPSWDATMGGLCVEVILTRTTQVNEVFAQYIRPQLPKYSTVSIIETSPAAQSSADALRTLLDSEKPKVRREPRFLPIGSSYTAAATGLLIRRWPWRLRYNLEPSDCLKSLPLFRDVNVPRLYVRLRDPSSILDTTRHVDTRPLFPCSAEVDVFFEVDIMRHHRPRLITLYFDIFSSFDSIWVRDLDPAKGIPLDEHLGFTKLCTIQSSVDSDSFRAVTVKESWYRGRRKTYDVNFVLRIFEMGPSKIGPHFHLYALDPNTGERAARETQVTWYAEPPHMVWPSFRVVGQGEYGRSVST